MGVLNKIKRQSIEIWHNVSKYSALSRISYKVKMWKSKIPSSTTSSFLSQPLLTLCNKLMQQQQRWNYTMLYTESVIILQTWLLSTKQHRFIPIPINKINYCWWNKRALLKHNYKIGASMQEDKKIDPSGATTIEIPWIYYTSIATIGWLATTRRRRNNKEVAGWSSGYYWWSSR